MKNSAKIYFPLFDNDGNDMDALKQFVIKDSIMYFGGLTTYSASGYYMMNDGIVKADKIEILEYYFDSMIYHAGSYPIDYLKGLAQVICNDAKQECVLLVIDNESFFINKKGE